MQQERQKKLENDLKQLPIVLNYEQRTIINHYIRTPVTIIKAFLEDSYCDIDSNGSPFYVLSKSEYDIITKELCELIGVAIELNKSNGEG